MAPEDSDAMEVITQVDTSFPITGLAWMPVEPTVLGNDLLMTSSDVLRLYKFDNNTIHEHVQLKSNFSNAADHPSPITNFHWNHYNPARVAAASVDTTVSIWNVERQQLESMCIAHDQPVFDVGFSSSNIFASVSSDGSLRSFDVRSLGTSQILFERPSSRPLLRLKWNRVDTNYITVLLEEPSRARGTYEHDVVVIDVRKPVRPVSSFSYGLEAINTMAWCPNCSRTMSFGTTVLC
jgi:WD repeat-containing protein 68